MEPWAKSTPFIRRSARLSASWGSIKSLPKTPQTSWKYGTEGFNGGLQLGSHYTGRHQPLGQLMLIFSRLVVDLLKILVETYKQFTIY